MSVLIIIKERCPKPKLPRLRRKKCQPLKTKVRIDYSSLYAEGPKGTKGGSKARKTLLKLGMKQFDGVTRVTLKKRDGMIFVVNDPQVLISEDGKSYTVLG